jgi:hypothetical protein
VNALYRPNSLKSEAAHRTRVDPTLNVQVMATDRANEDRPELEEAALLSAASDPRLPGLCRLPAALPAYPTDEAKPRAIRASAGTVKEVQVLTMALRASVLRRAVSLAGPLVGYPAAAPSFSAMRLRGIVSLRSACKDRNTPFGNTPRRRQGVWSVTAATPTTAA